MQVLTAIATLVALWLAARLLLLPYRRYRRRTVSGRQWQEYKSRLPQWVKLAEFVLKVALWLPIAGIVLISLVAIHNAAYPAASAAAGWRFGTMLFASLFAALAPGMILANCVSWMVPPMRRANLHAMEGFETSSFSSANAGLLKFGAIIVPLSLALGTADALIH